jgi:hypothetical protein
MPNHVHLILVPADGDGLRRALAPVHRRYVGHLNGRARRSGHFWQGRFGAVAMNEEHLGAALDALSRRAYRQPIGKGNALKPGGCQHPARVHPRNPLDSLVPAFGFCPVELLAGDRHPL